MYVTLVDFAVSLFMADAWKVSSINSIPISIVKNAFMVPKINSLYYKNPGYGLCLLFLFVYTKLGEECT